MNRIRFGIRPKIYPRYHLHDTVRFPGSELLTVEQKVNKPLMKVKSDRSFSKDQEKWLELIRTHLTKTLLMEREDVDFMPIFQREGTSWAKLNKVFKGELETIIHELNTAMAA